VDELLAAARGWLTPPVMAQADAPESTSAVTTETARLNARSDRSIYDPLVGRLACQRDFPSYDMIGAAVAKIE
jgi:hypothetical protein